MTFELHRLRARVERALWSRPDSGLPLWKKLAMRAARLLVVVVRDVVAGDLTLWTMSLVYTTLLSMVPLLALSFSVLKAFGVHNQVEPLLASLLAPLGPQGDVISSRLIEFIERMNVGVLGAVGLALLVYTVISLMQKIEESFNSIWHVTQLRRLADRFSRYLSAVLIVPMLVFAALSLTAAAMSSEIAKAMVEVEPFGTIVVAASEIAPYALVIGAFTLLYRFIPNTRVGWMPALLGGLVGGVLWQSAGWGFAAFVVSSTRYAAIYASFAILVLFLIWLYVSWLVLLVGAAVAFYVEHPQYLYARPGEPRLSNRMRERLAIAIMRLMADHFVRGHPPWTLHGLTHQLHCPMHSVSVVLDALIDGGVVVRTDADPPSFTPFRDLTRVSLADVLDLVRSAGEDSFLNPDSMPRDSDVERVAAGIEDAIDQATRDITVASLASPGSAGEQRKRQALDRKE